MSKSGLNYDCLPASVSSTRYVESFALLSKSQGIALLSFSEKVNTFQIRTEANYTPCVGPITGGERHWVARETAYSRGDLLRGPRPFLS